jgi:hypothetical protein
LNDCSLDSDVGYFHRHNYAMLKLFRIEKYFFDEICADIGGFWPNTGAAAIYMISVAPGASVYVHGITFYRTPYIEKYASHLNDLAGTIRFIESYGWHNPDLELLYLKKLIKSRKIETSIQLSRILDQPYLPIFYQNQAGRD